MILQWKSTFFVPGKIKSQLQFSTSRYYTCLSETKKTVVFSSYFVALAWQADLYLPIRQNFLFRLPVRLSQSRVSVSTR